MQLRSACIAVALVACDPAAMLNARSGPTPSEQNQQLAEQQRAEQQRQVDQFAATRLAEHERQRLAEQSDASRRDAEQKERIASSERQASERAKAHRDECASTYRARFLDMQKAAAELATLKPKMVARCKELAKHCSTSSSGQSYCHGLTGEEHQAFDQYCGGDLSGPITTPESESCADVDPEHLALDVAWSTQDAISFSKRKPPPTVAATATTASDWNPQTR